MIHLGMIEAAAVDGVDIARMGAPSPMAILQISWPAADAEGDADAAVAAE